MRNVQVVVTHNHLGEMRTLTQMIHEAVLPQVLEIYRTGLDVRDIKVYRLVDITHEVFGDEK